MMARLHFNLDTDQLKEDIMDSNLKDVTKADVWPDSYQKTHPFQ